ncbi:MAG: hypothetical protein L0177_20640 [Chloroflexi bacterium]|nr:hypothetical protein [Chloroflexota bacterium]
MTNGAKKLSDREMFEALEKMVADYRDQVQEAEARVREAERLRDERAARLKKAQDLLSYERERIGVPLSAPASGFRGLSLREAALKIIRENGGIVSAEHLAGRLKEAGYVFGSAPGRALHAALLGVAEVEKPYSGSYRWRGPRVDAAPEEALQPDPPT